MKTFPEKMLLPRTPEVIRKTIYCNSSDVDCMTNAIIAIAYTVNVCFSAYTQTWYMIDLEHNTLQGRVI